MPLYRFAKARTQCLFLICKPRVVRSQRETSRDDAVRNATTSVQQLGDSDTNAKKLGVASVITFSLLRLSSYSLTLYSIALKHTLQ
jgi:hypothetical protein